MRSETRWSYANWVAWGLGLLWAITLSAVGLVSSAGDPGMATFGGIAGPLGLIALAAIVLLKRRYLELSEDGLTDSRVIITHTFKYETVRRVTALRAAGREGLIIIECEVDEAIKRIRINPAQDRWPTFIARLWRRLPLLEVDLSPEMTRRIEAVRDERQVEVDIGIAPMAPLKYDLLRTYGLQVLIALPVFLIVLAFSGGGGAASCAFGACLFLPLIVGATALDYYLTRQNVHVELRPDGFGYRDADGTDYWIPWGELTAVGGGGGFGGSIVVIHAREKTILLRGQLRAMQHVRWAFAQALQTLDQQLATPTGPPPAFSPEGDGGSP